MLVAAVSCFLCACGVFPSVLGSGWHGPPHFRAVQRKDKDKADHREEVALDYRHPNNAFAYRTEAGALGGSQVLWDWDRLPAPRVQE